MVFYPVNESLQPASDHAEWPYADAVVAVNYFGFAQPLGPFEAYCKNSGACLIEDNAHGFLSRDESGNWLGLRGDIGLFSLRKTFLMINGAALVVREKEIASRLDSQLASIEMLPPGGLRVRRALRSLTGSRLPELIAAEALRSVRRFCKGHAIPLSDPEVEVRVPGPTAPSVDLLETLARQDFSAEIERRRKLYEDIAQIAEASGCQLVYPILPVAVVPCGLPAYCKDPSSLKTIARRFGLDCFRWPDLPDSVEQHAPAHYHYLYMVNFL